MFDDGEQDVDDVQPIVVGDGEEVNDGERKQPDDAQSPCLCLLVDAPIRKVVQEWKVCPNLN